MVQAPTEFALLLELARTDEARLDRERIRALAGQSLDWARLVREGERHQLTPLIHRNLKLHASDLIPADALHKLTARSLITARRNERFAAELARLNTLLRTREIEVISYKGPTAASELYGDIRLRTFGDMDFLVKRGDLDAVCDLLRENGYQNTWTGTAEQKELMEREQKEYSFISGPFSVEPHWSITARRFPFEIDYPSLWSRAREIDLNGSKLLTFGPEDMLLVLCVCGCKGKWKRLQMVSDVAEAMRRWPDLDWAACFDRAAGSRSARMLKLGLHLAHTLLDATLPDYALERICDDRRVAAIAEKVTKSLRAERKLDPRGEEATMFSPLLFSLREGPLDKLRYLVRTTTTPSTIHQERFNLSKSMEWAYRVLVPIHDYILRPAAHLLRLRSGDRSGEL
jgi:Uncharacterised nucleotidyltransferase